MMPILVEGDDVRSGRKAKARHGRLRPAQESMACRHSYSSVISIWVKYQTNCSYKHNETTHVVKTFIYELDVSYTPPYIFRSNDYPNYNKI